MIRVDRTQTAIPLALIADGPAATQNIAVVVEQQGADALQSDMFDGEVYASASVKEALWKMQHEKCCFCEHVYERKFSTVEHFRPKTSAVRKRAPGVVKDSGYWWLAYEFENLYFCCSNCNTPKRDYFPLAAGARALQRGELASKVSEDALILDPGGPEDPAAHLTFVRQPNGRLRIAPRNGSARGRETIAAAKLDRDDLDELRDKHERVVLAELAALHAELHGRAGLASLAARVVASAKKLCEPSSPFALFARAYFQQSGVL